ncbi:hypothetical protein [Paenibacillus sp. SI8]|uniref:hypothetical protein n=1 Tax=unclassified Paenibacillus TaxID=185978 RepID=UPI0034674089
MKPLVKERIFIYISAGYATAPNFLHVFESELARRFEGAGWSPEVVVQFPYGDWTRKGRLQLHEIGSDIWFATRPRRSRYGGKRLFNVISQERLPEDRLLLIGHSGGAVASVQAAEQLQQAGSQIIGVVQIGSPRCTVPVSLQEKVLYLRGVNPLGRSIDPVPLIGSWGGWERSRFGGLRWNSLKFAPVYRETLSIVGGHADYFRDHDPYVLNGTSNLQLTMSAIWSWLKNRDLIGNKLDEKEDEHD